MSESKELVTTAKLSKAELKKQLFEKNLKTINTYKLFPSISCQHGVKEPKFEFEDAETVDQFEGVIIAYTNTRELYFTQGGGGAPVCLSCGGQEDCVNGTVYGACKDCQYAAWGSAKEGPASACKKGMRMLILPTNKEGIYEMKVSATSIGKFNIAFGQATIQKFVLQYTPFLFTLEVGEAKGRKPWSIVRPLIQEVVVGDTKFVKQAEHISEAFDDKVTDKLQTYGNFYTPTEATEGAVIIINKDAPASPEIPPANEGDEKIAESKDGEVPF